MLMVSVQTLDTLNKLKEVSGYVRMTLDKLSGIHADVLRIDEDWRELIFPQLVDTLRKWTVRNPEIIPSSEKGFKDENAYETNDKNNKHRDCVYCEKSGHKVSD